MKGRTRERKIAFEILFEHDLNGKSIEEILSLRQEAGLSLPSDFGKTLIQGVVENQSRLDEIISKYAENWRLERMPYSDRTILRLAFFEIFYLPEIPIGVSINEAVELAKDYGTEDSSRFINGLLGKAVREYFPEVDKESKDN
jgi:N utilization substance protein B